MGKVTINIELKDTEGQPVVYSRVVGEREFTITRTWGRECYDEIRLNHLDIDEHISALQQIKRGNFHDESSM